MPHNVISGVLTIAMVAAYLGSVAGLINYLRRAHEDVWVALGRPTMFPDPAEHARNPWPFVEGAFRTLMFIFGDRYKELRDRQLTHLIWLVRMLLAANLIFGAAIFSFRP